MIRKSRNDVQAIVRVGPKYLAVGLCCSMVGMSAIAQSSGRASDPRPDVVAAHPSGQDGRPTPSYGSPLARPISIVLSDVLLADALRRIENESRVTLIWGSRVIPANKRVSVSVKDVPLGEVLQQVLRNTTISFEVTAAGKVMLVRRDIPTADSSSASTERRTVTGRVIDSVSRKGIGGASVTVVGSRIGAITNSNGVFQLVGIPVGRQSLSVRLLGYVPRVIEVTVGGGGDTSQPIIVLSQASTTLSEVVTTATGLQRRVEVSNDIAKVEVDELLKKAPARSVSDLLMAARIPGVDVTPSSGLPGSPTRIRLRGLGSISKSNDPIVIVDGIRIGAAMSTEAVNNQAVTGGTAKLANNQYVASRLDDLDPNSIETLEIIRGPSAAALYGTDAANGVIIITTKRGQAGQTHWQVGTDYSWNEAPGEYQPVYRAFGRDQANIQLDNCPLSNVFRLFCVTDSVSTMNPRNLPLVSNTAGGRDFVYTASVSGGTQTLQYFVTGGRTDLLGPSTLPRVERIRLRQLGEGIPGWLKRPDRSNRTNLSTQLNLQPTEGLQLNFMMEANRRQLQSAGADFHQPAGVSYAPDDTLTYALDGVVFRRQQLTSDVTGERMVMVATWQRMSWFMPTMTLGVDHNSRIDRRFDTKRGCVRSGCGLPDASISEFRGEQTNYTVNLQSGFPISLGRLERFLSLRPSVGLNLVRSLGSGLGVKADSLFPGSEDIGTAATREITPALSSNSAVGGWFTDVRVGIWQRFFTNVGFRQDLGSALSTRISPPTYPTLGTSWLISDEGFFPTNSFVNSLQLRVTYGHSARQPTMQELRGGYGNVSVIVDGQLETGVTATQLANFKLKPERAAELEYGFTAGLLNDRAMVNVTVSEIRNRDLLVPRDLAPSVRGIERAGGNFEYTENISKVFNRSVELSANGRIIDDAGLQWIVDVGFSSTLNRVQRLGHVFPFVSSDARIVEGYPLGSIWQYPVVAYSDVNDDGLLQPNELVVGDTLAFVGAPYPRYKLNYGSTVQLLNGRINLSANMAYDVGLTQNQLTYDRRGLVDPASPLSEQARAQIINSTSVGNRQTISVLRLNTASMTYRLPDEWNRMLKSSSATLAIQGSNLGLWTQYRGRDPGVNSTPVGEQLTDNGRTIPQPRKYAVSLRLTF